MLRQRILTALLGIPLIILISYFGGYVLLFSVIIISLLSLDELYRALKNTEVQFSKFLGFLGAVLFILNSHYFGAGKVAETLLLVVLLNLFYYVISFPRIKPSGVGLTLFSSIYIGFLLSFAILLRNMEEGFLFLMFAFILTWATDSGAYIIGLLLGRHKLHSTLSPKKTIEGSVGGILFPVMASIIFSFFIPQDLNIFKFVVLGILVGILGQLGDLTASAFKRHANLKDFGSILPGHGGFLDRFDSFLVIVPLVYYYIAYIC
ncbi:MAG: Phosphatidate cytidylyltransferase [Clostridia bacterium 41_269]|nr:MAG: Phosphatidate cytidylyltransferase [Clostridia bacterium 41_269]